MSSDRPRRSCLCCTVHMDFDILPEGTFHPLQNITFQYNFSLVTPLTWCRHAVWNLTVNVFAIYYLIFLLASIKSL